MRRSNPKGGRMSDEHKAFEEWWDAHATCLEDTDLAADAFHAGIAWKSSQDGWRPMSEAEKNGKLKIFWRLWATESSEYTWAMWDIWTEEKRGWVDEDGCTIEGEFTHFIELPPPPQSSEKEGE